MTLNDGDYVMYQEELRRVTWGTGRQHTIVIEGGRQDKIKGHPEIVVPVDRVKRIEVINRKGEGKA
jgi:hypothetical protein